MLINAYSSLKDDFVMMPQFSVTKLSWRHQCYFIIRKLKQYIHILSHNFIAYSSS